MPRTIEGLISTKGLDEALINKTGELVCLVFNKMGIPREEAKAALAMLLVQLMEKDEAPAKGPTSDL